MVYCLNSIKIMEYSKALYNVRLRLQQKYKKNVFKNNKLKRNIITRLCLTWSQLCMKQLRVFLLPLDEMIVHHRSLPCNLFGFSNNLPMPIYTPGWREALWELSVLPKNTTQRPQPGLEPRPLAPRTRALTMTSMRFPKTMAPYMLI